MKFSCCLCLIFLLFLPAVHGQPAVAQAAPIAQLTLVPYARVKAAPLGEISGIVRSRGHENRFWVHNDSGDSARIFAITGEGTSVLPTYSKFTFYGDEPEEGKAQWQGFDVLYADNIDWEDIAIDSHYLYLADTGNNANKRQNLAIYAISEIDPTASTRSAVILKIPVHYPEQQAFPASNWHFDSESLFVADEQLYLITKHRVSGSIRDWEPGANLYRLDTRSAEQSNALVYVDSNPFLTAASGADLSPDGQTLAVISYGDLWLFDKPARGDHWLSSSYRRYALDPAEAGQVEAITWQDNNVLFIANEGRDLFRLEISALPEE